MFLIFMKRTLEEIKATSILVREHHVGNDAQIVWSKLCVYARDSPKAAIKNKHLLSVLTSVKLNRMVYKTRVARKTKSADHGRFIS
jgi:hypothetical protein